jgi:chromosome segregation ATPase
VTDFLDKIPTKLLIALVLITFLFTGGLIAYAVIYQNNPVELFGIVKFGESADDLRKRLVKLQAESESRIAPEVHHAVLARLKEGEAKSSLPSSEGSKLKGVLKERDNRIAELTKDLAEAMRTVEKLTEGLSETRGKVENLSAQLQASRKTSAERSRQLKEQTEKMEKITSIERRKAIMGYVQQFEVLENSVGRTLNDYTEQSYVKEYNDILRALQKELPNDSYVQNATPLSIFGTRESFESSLKSTSSRMRSYLEQRYLK